MAQRPTLVIMQKILPHPGPVVSMIQNARWTAALDTLDQMESSSIDKRIVATNSKEIADLPSDCLLDIDRPKEKTDGHFHFGQRLAQVVQEHNIGTAVYFGAGSAPLLSSDTIQQVVEDIHQSDSRIITNNLHSSDWAAFTPASAMLEHADQIERDNALAWVLHHQAGLPIETLPANSSSRIDIDVPADLHILALHPHTLPRLRSALDKMNLDLSRWKGALDVLRTEGSHVIVAGRSSSDSWRALEGATRCWIRLIAEERGMVASGRFARGEVFSILGEMVDRGGLEALFQFFERHSDLVFMDNRVLMAHRNIWPSAEDRFASDMLWSSQVSDPFLRQFTERTASAALPVICGGHSLVSGGLLALAEIIQRS